MPSLGFFNLPHFLHENAESLRECGGGMTDSRDHFDADKHVFDIAIDILLHPGGARGDPAAQRRELCTPVVAKG